MSGSPAAADPWLSVVVPTYNGDAYLAAALESVVQQGDARIEVVAVDDGSDDATLRTLRAFANRIRLLIVEREHTGNWVASTNHGLSLARGAYVCILHQDDLWLPGRLVALRRLVDEAPAPTLIVHPSWLIDARGKRLGLWRCPLPPGHVLPTQLVVERLLVQNFLAMPAPLFRREVALRVGGMDESLWYAADWDLWLKLAVAGPVCHYPEALAAFRIHRESQTVARSEKSGELRRQLDAVLRRHLDPWVAGEPARRPVAAVARFSGEVNAALADHLHGKPACWSHLAKRFLSLGPSGWRRFFRDSRILERAGARLRLRLEGDSGRNS